MDGCLRVCVRAQAECNVSQNISIERLHTYILAWIESSMILLR